MKKLFSTAGILLLPFLLHCAELNYFSGTWDETIKKAKTEKKFVLLDCYTDWCSWCKVMDRTTFKSDTVTNELEKNFVACHREMEKDPEGLMLAMKYHIMAFPTFLIFSPEGKLVYIIVGYKKTADFFAELKKAENPATQENFPGYGPQMDPGYPSFYKKSFGTKETKVIPKRDTINNFLAQQKDLTSEVAWGVLSRFPTSTKYSESILTNAATLRKLYGKDEVDQDIYYVVKIKADSAIIHNNENELQAAMNNLDQYLPGDNQWTKISWRENFYEKNDQWKMLADLEQSIIDTSKIGDIANSVNSISWDFYEKCEDVTLCEMTLPWMKKLTDAYQEYPSMDTYACLLYKTGHYSEAKDVAIKAIELGKASGDKTDSTEKLLLDIQAKMK